VPGVPHRGWECVDIEDLGAPDAVCKMCEVQEIRYVHEMWHPDYGTLHVGCICAGHMEQDVAGARRRETEFKKQNMRRKNWLRREWHVSANGNHFLNVNNFNVVVFRKGRTWGARFVHEPTGYTRFSQRPYATEHAAMLAAFDAIDHYAREEVLTED
jgi:hypothetical protein